MSQRVLAGVGFLSQSKPKMTIVIPSYDILAGCCPTCPNICKEFARQEQTFKNSTINLDCADFDDAECYFECPQRCRDAFNRGETR